MKAPLIEPIESPFREFCWKAGWGIGECHPRTLPTLSQNHGMGFRSNIPVSELIGHTIALVSSNTQPQQLQGVGSHSGAGKGTATSLPFSKQSLHQTPPSHQDWRQRSGEHIDKTRKSLTPRQLRYVLLTGTIQFFPEIASSPAALKQRKGQIE